MLVVITFITCIEHLMRTNIERLFISVWMDNTLGQRTSDSRRALIIYDDGTLLLWLCLLIHISYFFCAYFILSFDGQNEISSNENGMKNKLDIMRNLIHMIFFPIICYQMYTNVFDSLRFVCQWIPSEKKKTYKMKNWKWSSEMHLFIFRTP